MRRLAKGEKPTAKNVRTVRILTPEQVATLLASGTPTWTPFLITVAYTGLRASEALGLRWQDVDTGAGVLHIRNQLGRDGTLLPLRTAESARPIPMAPDLRKALLEARVASESSLPTGFVFATETGRPQSYAKTHARAFDDAVEKAKLGDEPGARAHPARAQAHRSPRR